MFCNYFLSLGLHPVLHPFFDPSIHTASQEKDSFHHASTALFCRTRSVGRNELGKENFLLPPVLTFIVDTFVFLMGKTSGRPRLGKLRLVCSERPIALALQKFRGPDTLLLREDTEQPFHSARKPGLYLSAWQHPQAVYPVKLIAQSHHHLGAEQLSHPNQLLDTVQEAFTISHFGTSTLLLQCWPSTGHAPCASVDSSWAHRTTSMFHGCPCRKSCHCQEALRGASVRCGSNADWQETCNRFGNCSWHLFKKKKVEVMFVFWAGLLESPVLERRASVAAWLWFVQSWQHRRCFFREDSSAVHLAWRLGGGGFVPSPFNQCSNAWWEQEVSGTARPWHPRLCCTIEVSKPDCLGHLIIDFL